MHTRFLQLTTATAAILILAACGGDGGGGGAAAPTASTTISGSVVKGPVSGSTITVKNAATGAVLGTTTTTSSGTYTLSVPFEGDVVVEATGGTYTDEATRANATLSTPLRTVLTANGGNVTGVVTPLTTMAYTYAFGTATLPTASAFNTTATNIATQFQLSGVNLSTTVPVVSGTLNDYGRILAAISEYLRANAVPLSQLTSVAFSSAQSATFSTAFTTAYRTVVPDSNITFAFNGSTVSVGGTGAGGGAGRCGVNVQGTVTANGFTVPLNLDYCITGIAASSCNSGNASLSQAISGQGGVAGAANLRYTYSPSCVANPVVTINLQ